MESSTGSSWYAFARHCRLYLASFYFYRRSLRVTDKGQPGWMGLGSSFWSSSSWCYSGYRLASWWQHSLRVYRLLFSSIPSSGLSLAHSVVCRSHTLQWGRFGELGCIPWTHSPGPSQRWCLLNSSKPSPTQHHAGSKLTISTAVLWSSASLTSSPSLIRLLGRPALHGLTTLATNLVVTSTISTTPSSVDTANTKWAMSFPSL